MRDKPDDSLNFRKPAEAQPESVPGQEEPKKTAEQEQSRFSEEAPFRIKDQFSDINTIPPTMEREGFHPSKAPVPGASMAETAQPGRTIRKPAAFQDFFRNLDLIKIVRGIYRKFWVVLLAAFGVFLLFLPIGRVLQGGVNWSAESTIIYVKPTQKQIDVQGAAFLLRPLSQDTLIDMLISPVNVQTLENAIGIKLSKKNLSFNSQTKSDIVTLRISGMQSEKAAVNGVNKLAEIIIRENDLYYRQFASSAYDQYKARREAAEQNYRDAAKAVEDFQIQNQVLELNAMYQNYFASVNAATERLSIAQVAHEGLQVRITNYEKMIKELADEVLDEAKEANPLKGRISNAEAALLQARIQYASDNPKIQRQERELEELRKMLQSGSFDETRERTYVKNPFKGQLEGELLKLRAEEDVAIQQVTALKKDLETLQAKFPNMPRLEKEYAALLEKRAQMAATLKSLTASEESARLTMESNLADFKLINPAVSAEATAASLLGKIIPIVGFLLGFFIALALIIIIELLDAKIRTQQQLTTAYDAPCLASIIEIPHLENYDTYQLLLPSLREISERLNVVLQGHRAKVLGFFSSLDGEGKSILAFNLARYYSSLNIKVLFVGFDALPNPCLPGVTEAGWPQMGIEDYLGGKAELADMLLNVNGVDVIRVQQMRADLLDLAKGSAMPRLWDLIRQNYDLIITEAPAILDHPISGTIAGFQDEIIYVLASSVGDRRLVDAGLEFLEDRGLAPRALIFNRVDPYYIEDIRQQRIIRHLADRRTPLDDMMDHLRPLAGLFARFRHRPAQKDAVEETDETALTDEALPGEPIEDVGVLPEDEPLPEFIGEDEPAKQADNEGKPEDEKDPDVSFKDWLSEPDTKPGEESKDNEK